MPDPITWSALGGWVFTEGIKFLYGQASELLTAWRARGAAAAAVEPPASGSIDVPIAPSDALDGVPAGASADAAVLDREHRTLVRLTGALSPYAQGLAEIDPNDEELALLAGELRSLIEAVYGQRFTFRGETRERTGSQVSVTQVLGEVGGSVTGAEAEVAHGARLDVDQRATEVKPDGTVTGFKGTIDH
ncbi:hypothetical protein GCM10010329_34720 [Streptomyces spiroverticillatus]|uniref:Uncharacterized protein n=1 Tax=Streptomyces finlayi TaxID=67296 RepID=A0A918WWS3_9ACTN|nr:hypothetical protein [Streptomyces finlayi]GHA08939.1 hypothetical protein GCM10010329_34720 [Streptomyces spiroverticillatus]GHC91769.1 hypothetical protein GCM10010334_27130 [Streptomyces finlayi]